MASSTRSGQGRRSCPSPGARAAQPGCPAARGYTRLLFVSPGADGWHSGYGQLVRAVPGYETGRGNNGGKEYTVRSDIGLKIALCGLI